MVRKWIDKKQKKIQNMTWKKKKIKKERKKERNKEGKEGRKKERKKEGKEERTRTAWAVFKYCGTKTATFSFSVRL